jgi:small-conductance mechanosensitive channel
MYISSFSTVLRNILATLMYCKGACTRWGVHKFSVHMQELRTQLHKDSQEQQELLDEQHDVIQQLVQDKQSLQVIAAMQSVGLMSASTQNEWLIGCQACLPTMSARLLVIGDTVVETTWRCLCAQAEVVESQQSACETKDQLSQLLKELDTAQGKAASLARLHAEADEQLQQQASLLDQVCCST